MKLDVTCMRYLSKDDFRVLQAVEMGMRNHELVPVDLIAQIAQLKHGGSFKVLSTLLRYKLVAHANNKYDGYRLSYLGFDILALRTLLSRGIIASVGAQIGVGKESDIFEAMDENGDEVVLKIHRLGRTSFRSVRRNRDYMKDKHKASWLYMSRLAATKEYAFMEILYARGFPTPVPISHNRHVVAMSRISGYPMCQIRSGGMGDVLNKYYFEECMSLLLNLARHGLVHCDLNEFNIMILNHSSDDGSSGAGGREGRGDISSMGTNAVSDAFYHGSQPRITTSSTTNTTNNAINTNTNTNASQQTAEQQQQHGQTTDSNNNATGTNANNVNTNDPAKGVILIDFPQMVSTEHPNAEELFNRDKEGLLKFFSLKMKYSLSEEDEALYHSAALDFKHIIASTHISGGSGDDRSGSDKINATSNTTSNNSAAVEGGITNAYDVLYQNGKVSKQDDMALLQYIQSTNNTSTVEGDESAQSINSEEDIDNEDGDGNNDNDNDEVEDNDDNDENSNDDNSKDNNDNTVVSAAVGEEVEVAYDDLSDIDDNEQQQHHHHHHLTIRNNNHNNSDGHYNNVNKCGQGVPVLTPHQQRAKDTLRIQQSKQSAGNGNNSSSNNRNTSHSKGNASKTRNKYGKIDRSVSNKINASNNGGGVNW